MSVEINLDTDHATVSQRHVPNTSSSRSHRSQSSALKSTPLSKSPALTANNTLSQSSTMTDSGESYSSKDLAALAQIVMLKGDFNLLFSMIACHSLMLTGKDIRTLDLSDVMVKNFYSSSDSDHLKDPSKKPHHKATKHNNNNNNNQVDQKALYFVFRKSSEEKQPQRKKSPTATNKDNTNTANNVKDVKDGNDSITHDHNHNHDHDYSIKYTGSFRHKSPLLCSHLSLALALFSRYHIKGTNYGRKEDSEIDFSDPSHFWYLIKLFRGATSTESLSQSYHERKVKDATKPIPSSSTSPSSSSPSATTSSPSFAPDITTSKKFSVSEFAQTSAQHCINNGASPDSVNSFNNWVHKYYPKSSTTTTAPLSSPTHKSILVPSSPMHILSGFDLSENYQLQRNDTNAPQLPESVRQLIFPFINNYLKAIESNTLKDMLISLQKKNKSSRSSTKPLENDWEEFVIVHQSDLNSKMKVVNNENQQDQDQDQDQDQSHPSSPIIYSVVQHNNNSPQDKGQNNGFLNLPDKVGHNKNRTKQIATNNKGNQSTTKKKTNQDSENESDDSIDIGNGSYYSKRQQSPESGVEIDSSSNGEEEEETGDEESDIEVDEVSSNGSNKDSDNEEDVDYDIEEINISENFVIKVKDAVLLLDYLRTVLVQDLFFISRYVPTIVENYIFKTPEYLEFAEKQKVYWSEIQKLEKSNEINNQKKNKLRTLRPLPQQNQSQPIKDIVPQSDIPINRSEFLSMKASIDELNNNIQQLNAIIGNLPTKEYVQNQITQIQMESNKQLAPTFDHLFSEMAKFSSTFASAVQSLTAKGNFSQTNGSSKSASQLKKKQRISHSRSNSGSGSNSNSESESGSGSGSESGSESESGSNNDVNKHKRKHPEKENYEFSPSAKLTQSLVTANTATLNSTSTRNSLPLPRPSMIKWTPQAVSRVHKQSPTQKFHPMHRSGSFSSIGRGPILNNRAIAAVSPSSNNNNANVTAASSLSSTSQHSHTSSSTVANVNTNTNSKTVSAANPVSSTPVPDHPPHPVISLSSSLAPSSRVTSASDGFTPSKCNTIQELYDDYHILDSQREALLEKYLAMRKIPLNRAYRRRARIYNLVQRFLKHGYTLENTIAILQQDMTEKKISPSNFCDVSKEKLVAKYLFGVNNENNNNNNNNNKSNGNGNTNGNTNTKIKSASNKKSNITNKMDENLKNSLLSAGIHHEEEEEEEGEDDEEDDEEENHQGEIINNQNHNEHENENDSDKEHNNNSNSNSDSHSDNDNDGDNDNDSDSDSDSDSDGDDNDNNNNNNDNNTDENIINGHNSSYPSSSIIPNRNNHHNETRHVYNNNNNNNSNKPTNATSNHNTPIKSLSIAMVIDE